MKNSRDKYQFILIPLSWLYGFLVRFRNFLFDTKLLKSESFDIPIISIGNLTVGGTGKTPHTEYMIGLLKKFEVAVLSRGYKRQTSGFVLAKKDSSSLEIGDEPRQIKAKFQDIPVAVDGNRRRGIKNLLKEFKTLDVVVLDDAFQHRYVAPSLSIVLMDYSRPIYNDTMLPSGNLREHISSLKRANVVIVTKTPEDIKPIEKRVVSKQLDLYPFQSLFFSRLKYGKLQPVFQNSRAFSHKEFTNGDLGVVLLTGIASPKPLVQHLEKYSEKVEHLIFPDHYTFKAKDIKLAHAKMEKLGYSKRLIITTEKDAIRMLDMKDFPKEVKNDIYFIPIEIEFLEDQDNFDETVISLLRRARPITK